MTAQKLRYVCAHAEMAMQRGPTSSLSCVAVLVLLTSECTPMVSSGVQEVKSCQVDVEFVTHMLRHSCASIVESF